MSQAPIDALDALIADFAKNSAALPQVNPPEAVKVLEQQTKPEVAGEPEPALELPTAPAPTEKPAEVLASEAAKKTRGRKPAVEKQADKPLDLGTLPAQSVSRALAENPLEDLLSELARRGYSVYLHKSATGA